MKKIDENVLGALALTALVLLTVALYIWALYS